MKNVRNQNYHRNYKINEQKYASKRVLQGGRSSVTSAGDSVDELPNEATVDSTQSSPGRRTDWDEVTVSSSSTAVSSTVSHVTHKFLTTPNEPLASPAGSTSLQSRQRL